MSHATVLLIIKFCPHLDKEEVEETIEQMMYPYLENGKDTEEWNHKWDWYQIGGRWAGRLLTVDDGMGFRFGASLLYDDFTYDVLQYDSALIKEMQEESLKKLVTAAVLDENGWHEPTQMGWWGMSGLADNVDEVFFPTSISTEDVCKYIKRYKKEAMIMAVKALMHYYKCLGSIYHLKKNVDLGGGKVKVTKEIREARLAGYLTEVHWDSCYYEKWIKPLGDDDRITIVDYHI